MPAQKIAVIITAYKNLSITHGIIEHFKGLDLENLHVYIVADAVEQVPASLPHSRIYYLKPEVELGLKLKSIEFAIEQWEEDFPYVAIFDADNDFEDQFFDNVYAYIAEGFELIQGRRVAGNLNTSTARVDSISEVYKNYVDRWLPFKLGSSATLSGSGFVISADLLQSFIRKAMSVNEDGNVNALIAEDKLLQNYSVSNGHRIAYAWNAKVIDAKVDSRSELLNQRSKWLYAYFQNIPSSLGHIFKGALKLNWNRFLFGLVSFTPPVVVLLGLTVLLIIVALFTNQSGALTLILSLFIFMMGIILSLALTGVSSEVWRSLWAMPLFAITQLKSLLYLIIGKRKFKPTKNITDSDQN